MNKSEKRKKNKEMSGLGKVLESSQNRWGLNFERAGQPMGHASRGRKEKSFLRGTTMLLTEGRKTENILFFSRGTASRGSESMTLMKANLWLLLKGKKCFFRF